MARNVLDVVRLADVELGGHHAAPRRLDAVGRRVEVGDVAVADGHVGTEVGERQGDRLADPDRGAGHDRDAVGQKGRGGVERHGRGG